MVSECTHQLSSAQNRSLSIFTGQEGPSPPRPPSRSPPTYPHLPSASSVRKS
ncbi:hypothetical protein VKT23_014453 [Stygiomarasmius scandens]|uniref:Uncharacterized protein n=1 Tax=Marasmiellus scandens TaxID=2682957 RepID=A0ABR1J384_9AGAR